MEPTGQDGESLNLTLTLPLTRPTFRLVQLLRLRQWATICTSSLRRYSQIRRASILFGPTDCPRVRQWWVLTARRRGPQWVCVYVDQAPCTHVSKLKKSINPVSAAATRPASLSDNL